MWSGGREGARDGGREGREGEGFMCVCFLINFCNIFVIYMHVYTRTMVQFVYYKWRKREIYAKLMNESVR